MLSVDDQPPDEKGRGGGEAFLIVRLLSPGEILFSGDPQPQRRGMQIKSCRDIVERSYQTSGRAVCCVEDGEI